MLKLYLQHFRYLLTVSRFKRFNILHCLKKATLVRRLLHALKANTFDSAVNGEILGKRADMEREACDTEHEDERAETLSIVLQNHWSIQDA